MHHCTPKEPSQHPAHPGFYWGLVTWAPCARHTPSTQLPAESRCSRNHAVVQTVQVQVRGPPLSVGKVSCRPTGHAPTSHYPGATRGPPLQVALPELAASGLPVALFCKGDSCKWGRWVKGHGYLCGSSAVELLPSRKTGPADRSGPSCHSADDQGTLGGVRDTFLKETREAGRSFPLPLSERRGRL